MALFINAKLDYERRSSYASGGRLYERDVVRTGGDGKFISYATKERRARRTMPDAARFAPEHRSVKVRLIVL